MKTIDITKVRNQLSKLVERAADGQAFITSKRGKPLVRVEALEQPHSPRKRRLGFLEGQFTIPDDFDKMGTSEIQRMFGTRRQT